MVSADECAARRVLIDSSLEITGKYHQENAHRDAIVPSAQFYLCGPAQADDQIKLVLRGANGGRRIEHTCVVGESIPTGRERNNPQQVGCTMPQPLKQPGLFALDIIYRAGGRDELLRTAWLRVAPSRERNAKGAMAIRSDFRIDEAWMTALWDGYPEIRTWVIPGKSARIGYRWFHNGSPVGDAHMVSSVDVNNDDPLDRPIVLNLGRPNPSFKEIRGRDGMWSIRITFNGELARELSFQVVRGQIMPQPVQAAGAPDRLRGVGMLLKVDRKAIGERILLTPAEMTALRWNGVLGKPSAAVAKSTTGAALDASPYARTTLRFETSTITPYTAKNGEDIIIPEGTGVTSSTHKTPGGGSIVFRTDSEVRISLRGGANKRLSVTVTATAEAPGALALPPGALDRIYSTEPRLIESVRNVDPVKSQTTL